MSVFDRLDRMISRTVDHVNASVFTLMPLIRTPNGRAMPDPDRPAITGRGILDLEPSEAGLQLGNRRADSRQNDLRSLRTGSEPVLSVDARYFPSAACRPRQGDLVEVAGRNYEIVSVQPDGGARIELVLVAA